MLRYKVYAVVTHPYFIKVAYMVSYLTFFASLVCFWDASYIEENAFVSENALNASNQETKFLVSDCGLWEDIRDADEYLRETIQAEKQDEVYTYLVRASRAHPSENIAFFFSIHEESIDSLNIARDLIRFLEKYNDWLGKNILFVFFSESPPFQNIKSWVDSYGSKSYFGHIRLAFVWELHSLFSYMTMISDGNNGVQNDIDMVETIKRTLKMSKVKSRFPEAEQVPDYMKKVRFSLHSWKSNLFGNTDKLHAYLLEKGILSVTFETKTTDTKLVKLEDMKIQISCLMELLLRTFSSLEEQLHAGYYFYYYSSPLKMVVLGKYAYLLACIVLPVILRGLMILQHEWFDLNSFILLVFPYFLTLLENSLIGKMSFPVGISALVLRLVFKPNRQVLVGYSHLALGIIMGLVGFKMMSVAVLLSWIVLVKLAMTGNNWVNRIFIIGLFVPLFFLYDERIVQLQVVHGHYLFACLSIVLIPTISHIFYLII